MKQGDRMGIYIGGIRDSMGIPLKELAAGLCSEAYLNRIETGEREAGKLMTDMLLQRLGKSTGRFLTILDGKESETKKQRQQILDHLMQNDLERAAAALEDYHRYEKCGKLHRQFAGIAELNLCYRQHVPAAELRGLALQTLRLTQPWYGKTALKTLCLGWNECQLILAYLELSEQSGEEAFAIRGYQELADYLRQPRYAEGEKAALLPQVLYRMAECAYRKKELKEAEYLCENAIAGLQAEKKTTGCLELLRLRVQIQKQLGEDVTETERLFIIWQGILEQYREGQELWLSYEEGGNVYNCNQVLRGRREMLGCSRQALANGICDAITLYRIEQGKGSPQKRVRKQLLEAVGLSGERYDYELITEDYDDYHLRIELDRAWNAEEYDRAGELLECIRRKVPDIPTNRQYLMKMETNLLRVQGKLTEQECEERLHQALKLTLPEDYERRLVICALSVNETLLLLSLALSYKRQKKYESGIRILRHLKRCMESTGFALVNYEDLYTLCVRALASMLGSFGQYEESDSLAEKCLKLALRRGDGYLLSDLLYTLAWNSEQRKKGTESIHLLRQSYAVACLFGDKVMQRHIEKHVQQEYDGDILH